MKQHLIDKKTTNVVKTIAILIVVIGHYARFKEIPLSFVSHVPYFGAALFAFMSGYGTMLSYIDNPNINWGWFAKKFYRVYFPFLLVNVMSIPLYGKTENLISDMLLGTNDSVMWYPIFIMCFYVLFAIIMNIFQSKGWGILCGLVFLVYILLNCIDIGSQWYTSIFALIAGVFTAENETLLKKKKTWMYVAVFLYVATVIISQVTDGTIKYLITSFSGMLFSFVIFAFVRMSCDKYPKIKKIGIIGENSYFVYLVHMKIFLLVGRLIGTTGMVSFIIFLIGTAGITAILQKFWMLIGKRMPPI